MGCLCSKEAVVDERIEEDPTVKKADLSKSSVQLVAPSKREEIESELSRGSQDGSSRPVQRVASQASAGSVRNPSSHNSDREKNGGAVAERHASSHHRIGATASMGRNRGGRQDSQASRIATLTLPNGIEGDAVAAGWPSWLTSVAAEAVQGLVPRRAESFKKLTVIGRGTYSCVYKAHDLETGKTVAMKKVRFSNMDPESVRFMAREIQILRKLDHPNIIQLEGIVASKTSDSLYLIFEYMDHDLAGILSRPGMKLSESQIKCYMQQLLRGLDHCHSQGILHRDIKGSNLLISGDGVLKIGDWGLANFDQQQPLTSRVVTLWYRAPELLLGATKYGVDVDLWSAGCILGELFAGEPILPGRTEVEQLHKILKLCGSPPEDYWMKTRLPRATSFKPQGQYKRHVAERFKDVPSTTLSLIEKLLSLEPRDRGSAASALGSEFFTTKPLPCDSSCLPKVPPSKELDIKLRDEEAKRRKAESVKGRGPESVNMVASDANAFPTSEFTAHAEVSLQGESNPKSVSHKFDHQDSGSGFPMGPPRRAATNEFTHSGSMIHPSAAGSSKWTGQVSTVTHDAEFRTQTSFKQWATVDRSSGSRKDESGSANDTSYTVYLPKRNRIHCSGPLVPPGGNIEDMLKEHERQIQQAFRNARLDRNRTSNTNGYH